MPVFVTTHWSVVLAASDRESPDSTAALEALCRTYWFPIYGLVRRWGHGPEDAEDLTQEFFARLLGQDQLRAADREQGRFRTFLRVVLQRFLANQRERSRAEKRGGGFRRVPLDTSVAEARWEGAAELGKGLGAEAVFERQWAFSLLEEALNRLRTDHLASGREAEFQRLKPYLASERGEIPYAAIASDLGIREGAARVAVHRLRKRFRELFRAAVADTVADPSEVDAEVRHVASLLAGG
ncbi:MAG: sigma-70 family RNA polymerase sigma factor [Verrucomicrobia bacterium]|nr:sigma-70 family RNA polymerase sigma factor [Verrucomicrobiota bacterium]